MANDTRARKLADRIKVVVAETLEKRVKDPRLGFITITDARVTGDLREASVFYTVLGDDAQWAATAAALEASRGLLRSEVGRQTGVRYTPSLTFFADAIPETARQLDDLLKAAKDADAAVAAVAQTAQYAGDANPYKEPAADDDDEDDEGFTGPDNDGDIQPADGFVAPANAEDGDQR